MNLSPQKDGKRLKYLLDLMSDPACYFNEFGELEFANDAAMQALGIKYESTEKLTFCDVAESGEMSFQQVIEGIRSGMMSGHMQGHDKCKCNKLSLSLWPFEETAGHFAAFCVLDMMETKGREILLEHVFKDAVDAMLILDARTHTVLDQNNEATRLTGYVPGELKGRLYTALFSKKDAAVLHIESLTEGQRTTLSQVCMCRKSGSCVPVEASALLIRVADRRYIIMTMHDVTERNRREAEINKKNNELSALNYLSATVNSSLDLKTILERSIHKACEVTGMHIGCIFLLDSSKGKLVPSSCAGISTNAFRSIDAIDVNECFEGQSVAKGKPVIVEDFSACPTGMCMRICGEARSFICIPIIFQGIVIGAMSLISKEQKHFTTDDIRLFSSIANTIGIAINNAFYVERLKAQSDENARLAEGMRKRNEELRRVYEILRKISQSIDLDTTMKAIVDNVPYITKLPYCMIFLLDPWAKQIVAVKLTEKEEKKFGKLKFDIKDLVASRIAIMERRALFIEDAPGFENISKRIVDLLGMKSAIVMPLIARGRVLGVMWLYSSEKHVTFDEDDRRSALALSDQAAIAIDNARLFKELEVSYEKLKDMDKVKMEFFTLISHEMRNPLAVIKGFAELLYDGALGPINDAQKERLSKIIENIDRMTDMVGKMSDISALERKKYAVEKVPVALSDAIGSVIDSIGFLVKEKGIQLNVDIPAGLPLVDIDRDKIEEVLLNLINNAVKYTSAGGKIFINARDRESDILISVTDTGIGIPKNDLDKIFSGFYHAGYKLSYEYKGPGLGLAISKKIVESHGGHIWVESEVGKGSTFYFTIPKNIEKLATEKSTASNPK